MTTCVSCGLPIPDGQGRSCSMCYGDIAYGRDGYYEKWAREQNEKKEDVDPLCKGQHLDYFNAVRDPREEGA